MNIVTRGSVIWDSDTWYLVVRDSVTVLNISQTQSISHKKKYFEKIYSLYSKLDHFRKLLKYLNGPTYEH
jgi:hypothetical protein